MTVIHELYQPMAGLWTETEGGWIYSEQRRHAVLLSASGEQVDSVRVSENLNVEEVIEHHCTCTRGFDYRLQSHPFKRVA